MNRIFPGSSAFAFSLAAALAYGIAQLLQATWVLGMFYLLAAAAGVFVAGWVSESLVLMIEFIQGVKNDLQRDLTITTDRDLLLAEMLRRMSAEQLSVYSAMVGMVHDPYDKDSVIIPGFNLLTRSFAVSYFAACEKQSSLIPIRNYSEGRADRQRDQAIELIDWLVTGGYARRAAYNSEAQWMNADSSKNAIIRLGLRTDDVV